MRVADVQDLQRELAAAAEALAAEKAARREEAAAAAAEIAQLTERLKAAEQAPRHSDMSDSPDISTEPSYATPPETVQDEVEQDLEQAQGPLAGHTTLFARGLGWQGELTLFRPWRSRTLKGLSQNCTAHWTDRNEADFRDRMYHSSFRWRVLMMLALVLSTFVMALVDPCLTIIPAGCTPIVPLTLSSQIAAQRMVDKRRGRWLGQSSMLLIGVYFGWACFAVALYGLRGEMPKWTGGTCRWVDDDGLGMIDLRHMIAINLSLGPISLFVGIMMTVMTISPRVFVAMFISGVIPFYAAYLLRERNANFRTTTNLPHMML